MKTGPIILTEKGKGPIPSGNYVVYGKDTHELRCRCCHQIITKGGKAYTSAPVTGPARPT